VNTDSTPIAWSLAPVIFEPGADEVHLWCASLDYDALVLSRLERTLSPDEEARANRFVFKTDRNRFVVARGILRELLGAYLMLSPTEVRFRYGPQGKPTADPEICSSTLQFNLSHSNGLAVYAFAHGRGLGIDVERVRPELAGEEIAERFFGPRELAELRALSPQLRAEGFFLCWTRKEAYVKAHGAGLNLPLDTFVVSLTPGRPAELESVDSSRWTLKSFKPSPGFVGAIVGEGKDWRLHYRKWQPKELR
jgi:4'-phosphopantetheinyl transferase